MFTLCLFTKWIEIVGVTENTWTACNIMLCLHVLAGDSSPQSRYLDRSVLFHRIDNLNPQSTYTITICALYGNSEGPEISLSQLTGTERKWGVSLFQLLTVHLKIWTALCGCAPTIVIKGSTRFMWHLRVSLLDWHVMFLGLNHSSCHCLVIKSKSAELLSVYHCHCQS